MNNEKTYKKLAELSFEDLYVETEKVPAVKMAIGRAYASIHRRSERMPHSLRVGSDYTERQQQYMQATYVLPHMS
jgi:hypothetical protein